jgi:cobalt/nickel transport system permease protein
MALPEWMLRQTVPEEDNQNAAAPPESLPLRLPRRGILRKGLGGLAHLLDEILTNEAIAGQYGLLQRVEPRIKVLGIIMLIVAATLVHHSSTLALALGMCLLLAGLSRVPVRRLARSWLAVPLFSAAIILPALLNIVTPGQPLLTLWRFSETHIGPWEVPPALTITDAGVYIAGRFVLRTAVCITLALLLTATTRAARLFRGLRALGVPVLFVMMLGMMERYLTIFIRAAEEIHLAKISRSIIVGNLRAEQAWVAAGMGALFRRTQSLSAAVHLAMISRGYTGEIYLLDEPRLQLTDWAFFMVAAGFAVVMLIMG